MNLVQKEGEELCLDYARPVIRDRRRSLWQRRAAKASHELHEAVCGICVHSWGTHAVRISSSCVHIQGYSCVFMYSRGAGCAP